MRTWFLLSMVLGAGCLSFPRATYVIDDHRDDGIVQVATCTLTEQTRTMAIRGSTYDIVVRANKTVTFTTNNSDLTFAFDASSTFEDFDHETNVTISADGRQLLMQRGQGGGGAGLHRLSRS